MIRNSSVELSSDSGSSGPVLGFLLDTSERAGSSGRVGASCQPFGTQHYVEIKCDQLRRAQTHHTTGRQGVAF